MFGILLQRNMACSLAREQVQGISTTTTTLRPSFSSGVSGRMSTLGLLVRWGGESEKLRGGRASALVAMEISCPSLLLYWGTKPICHFTMF